MFILQCPILWYAKVCALPSAHSMRTHKQKHARACTGDLSSHYWCWVNNGSVYLSSAVHGKRLHHMLDTWDDQRGFKRKEKNTCVVVVTGFGFNDGAHPPLWFSNSSNILNKEQHMSPDGSEEERKKLQHVRHRGFFIVFSHCSGIDVKSTTGEVHRCLHTRGNWSQSSHYQKLQDMTRSGRDVPS